MASAAVVQPRRSISPIWWGVGIAWLVIIGSVVSGLAPGFGHGRLLGPQVAVWPGVAVFLVGWLVMVIAMMVPTAIEGSAAEWRQITTLVVFWLLFGALAFVADSFLHAAVARSGWLIRHPSLISGAALVIGGAYQLTELKAVSLRRCRESAGHVANSLGWRRAMESVTCCGGTMLVCFAIGMASLEWMVALAMLMLYEQRGRFGVAMATLSGLALLGSGLATAFAAATIP
jgi:predicted metal-binding membrane protein